MTKYGDGYTFAYYDPSVNQYPAPVPGILDAPCVGLNMNVEWRGFLIGAISRLAWFDVWEGNDTEKLRAVTEIDKFLDTLDGSNTMRLRQNPTDDCILEQSLDCGQTWSTAFDYNLCAASTRIAITTIYNIQAELNVNTEIAIYLSAPGSYAPDIEDENEGTDAAYCFALRVFIEGALAGAIERKENENKRNQEVMVIGESIAILAAWWSGGLVAGISAAIGSAVSLILDSIFDALDLAGLRYLAQDDTQLKQLVCCAYEDMKGLRLTETIWNDNWGESSCLNLSDQAEEFRPILHQIVQAFDTYVLFLKGAQEAWEYHDAGLLADNCETDCPEYWEANFLDGNGWHEELVLIPNTAGGLATYDSGEDEVVGACNAPGTYYGYRVRLYLPEDTVVTELHTEAEMKNTRPSWTMSASGDEGNWGVASGELPAGGTANMDLTGKSEDYYEIRFQGLAGNITCGDGAYNRLTKVMIRGYGTNPFA